MSDWKKFFPVHRWTSCFPTSFWAGGAVVAFFNLGIYPTLAWTIGNLLWSRIVYFFDFDEEVH